MWVLCRPSNLHSSTIFPDSSRLEAALRRFGLFTQACHRLPRTRAWLSTESTDCRGLAHVANPSGNCNQAIDGQFLLVNSSLFIPSFNISFLLAVCHLLRPSPKPQGERGDKNYKPTSKMSIELNVRNGNNAMIRRMAPACAAASLSLVI